MTDYKKLVEALRCCKIHIPCKECPKYKSTGSLCVSDLHDDAAAAIEELQAEVQELKRVNLEIFEDLPKLGEWILQASGQDCKCSVCESYWIPFGYEYDYKFCPNCGAKMEVQDGQK